MGDDGVFQGCGIIIFYLISCPVPKHPSFCRCLTGSPPHRLSAYFPFSHPGHSSWRSGRGADSPERQCPVPPIGFSKPVAVPSKCLFFNSFKKAETIEAVVRRPVRFQSPGFQPRRRFPPVYLFNSHVSFRPELQFQVMRGRRRGMQWKRDRQSHYLLLLFYLLMNLFETV